MGGDTDLYGEVVLLQDGFIAESAFAPSTGLLWADLAKLLDHPFVQRKLDEIRGE